jgi:hypothetical protein
VITIAEVRSTFIWSSKSLISATTPIQPQA